jgi:PEP-CTERM motif
MRLLSTRPLFAFVAALGLAFGVASQASATVLSFTGTIGVNIAGLGTIPLTGAGAATVNGSSPGTHLSSFVLGGGTFAGQVPVPITDPAAAPINGLFLSIVGNNPGTFAGFSGGGPAGGVMGINGQAVVCLFAFFGTIPCPVAGLSVPFSQNGTRGLGIGGAPIAVFNTAVNIGVTVQGFPWAGSGSFGTTGSPVVAFAHGPASGDSSSAAQGSGVVQLVSPLLINTTIPASSFLAGYGILTLHFVPEPGTLLLLATGAAGLALVGRKRMRK